MKKHARVINCEKKLSSLEKKQNQLKNEVDLK